MQRAAVTKPASRCLTNVPHGTAHFFFRLLFFCGTFAPPRRASDKPMAIACFRVLTVIPARPRVSFPRLRSCIAFFTFCWALGPYLAIACLLSADQQISRLGGAALDRGKRHLTVLLERYKRSSLPFPSIGFEFSLLAIRSVSIFRLPDQLLMR